MRRVGMWTVVGLLLALLGYGVTELFKMRIGRGDVFPEYSSLRADPLGSRALFDAAGLLPGRESVRWLKPMDRLQAGAGDAVFVAGIDRNELFGMDREDWAVLDRAAIAGAHVVVAWRADHARPEDAKRVREIRNAPWETAAENDPTKDIAKDAKDASSEETGDQTSDADDAENARKTLKELRRERELLAPLASSPEARWGYRLLRRELLQRTGQADALRAEDAGADWPEALRSWRSDLFFMAKPGEGWTVFYRRGTEPVMMRRARGAGSVTLLADSYVLSNEAMQRERATPVLAALLGDARRVVFVESHLGVQVETGIAVLARRYGLAGAALMALLLAGLWIWRSAAPFAPVIEDEEEVRLVLAPTAGLEALLRRSIAPTKLFAACVDAWRGQASEGDRRRMDAATLPEGATNDPVASYNATRKALSHKKLT